jgi:DNA-binding NarL/FixJ family response regulator
MPPYEPVPPRGSDYRLTPRELEVLHLSAQGMSSQEIGERLGISDATVRTHYSKAARKLGARTPTQAGARALELGIIRP